jgi:dUTP pyrophosphatase
MILCGSDVAECMAEIKDYEKQVQPNGFDMLLKEVRGFRQQDNLKPEITFDEKVIPRTSPIPFNKRGKVFLGKGIYKIVLSPDVTIPIDCIGLLRPRSSLIRSGCNIASGIWDAGFSGKSEVLLIVENYNGIILHKDARIAQFYMQRMEKDAHRGYDGDYGNNVTC